MVRLVVTGGSLTQRLQRSLRYLLDETTWQINEQKCKLSKALIGWRKKPLIFGPVNRLTKILTSEGTGSAESSERSVISSSEKTTCNFFRE